MTASKLILLSVLAIGVPGVVLNTPPAAEVPPTSNVRLSECELIALALLESSREEASAEFWMRVAKILHAPNGLVMSEVSAAWTEKQEAEARAEAQYEARLTVNALLGQGIYDPAVDPAQFTSEVTNEFFPLVVGRTLVYERQSAEGLERITSTTLATLVDVEGVQCCVVHDVQTLDEELVEDTYDWLAQHVNGDVWYFGESAKHFEDGFLIDLEGSWRAGREGARPGIVMLGSPTVDAMYRQEYQANEAEDIARIISTGETVTTSQGTFTNCVLIEEWSPLENERELKYFAPGIGVVLEVNPATGERLELVKITGN